MDVKEVDPNKLSISDLNERKEDIGTSGLEQSVKEQGVIQPPLVRENGGGYEVVVGQRRTLAAQSAGLELMPVVVMNMDDGDALEASITENVEAFNENVSRRDRAFAIQRLKEMKRWNNRQVADSLGVHPDSITQWLEYTRDEWEGTAVDPEYEGQEDGDVTNLYQEVEDLSPDIIKVARSATGGGEKGEELLRKAVEHDLNKDDVRELSKKVDRGRDINSALTRVIEEKHSTGDIKVKANVTFSGDHAGALTSYAKDRGMTENEAVRKAISDFLEREGYL